MSQDRVCLCSINCASKLLSHRFHGVCVGAVSWVRGRLAIAGGDQSWFPNEKRFSKSKVLTGILLLTRSVYTLGVTKFNSSEQWNGFTKHTKYQQDLWKEWVHTNSNEGKHVVWFPNEGKLRMRTRTTPHGYFIRWKFLEPEYHRTAFRWTKSLRVRHRTTFTRQILCRALQSYQHWGGELLPPRCFAFEWPILSLWPWSFARWWPTSSDCKPNENFMVSSAIHDNQ